MTELKYLDNKALEERCIKRQKANERGKKQEELTQSDNNSNICSTCGKQCVEHFINRFRNPFVRLCPDCDKAHIKELDKQTPRKHKKINPAAKNKRLTK